MTNVQSSHRQILKSTSLIGGARVITIVIGIVRVKILAVILGPSGIGLFGIYQSVTDLVSKIAGMGIHTSGVRHVAEANSLGDRNKISRTVMTVRITTVFLGTLGGAALLFFCVPLSHVTFGDVTQAGALAILSLSVLFTTMASGQVAVVQGMRRIADLASIQVLGAIIGVLVTVPLVLVFQEKGVAPAMVAMAAALAFVSAFYFRKLPVDRISIAWKHVWAEARVLISFGLAVMLSGLMTAATSYLIRVYVNQELGLEAAGYYQAAYTMSGVYVGMILTAMAADFFPRLSAVADDNQTCNRLVNEQAEVALLLAGPGIVATLLFAPLVMSILYSEEFLPAVEVLRWQILGVMGRIVSWPMGFMILAKGRGRLFVATEAVSNVIHLLLVVYTVNKWGLAGVGISFFVLYVYYSVLMRFVVGRLSGFAWTRRYVRLFVFYSSAVLVAFVLTQVVSGLLLMVSGFVVLGCIVFYSLSEMMHMAGVRHVREVLTVGFWKRIVGH